MAEERIAVIGGGVIGIAVAAVLAGRGRRVDVFEAREIAAGASFGNAGGIAVSEVVPLSGPGMLRQVPGWLLDAEGPLAIRWPDLPGLVPWLWRFLQAGRADRIEKQARALAALMGRVYPEWEPLLAAAGLSSMLRRNGAITVYRHPGALAADAFGWDLRRRHGVRIETLSAREIRDLEPALADDFVAGMRTPDWGHVGDPGGLVTGLWRYAAGTGRASLHRRAVRRVIPREPGGELIFHDGGRACFTHVVIAAGVWSRALCAGLGWQVPLAAERGYHITLSDPGVELRGMVTFGERKFVATSMDMGLRLAGTVELGRAEGGENWRRADILAEMGRRYFNGLRTGNASRWMGPRPSLPDSLPVIGTDPRHKGIHYAFGHGHLGLTQASVTAAMIADLIMGRHPAVDPAPFSIARF